MTGSGYIKGDYKRACSICGHPWFFKRDMRYIGQNRWACPDDAAGLTAEQIARHNSKVKPLLIRQVKHPLPRVERSDYLMAEAKAFRAVIDHATDAATLGPTGAIVGTTVNAPRVAAWSALYLAGVISDATRPSAWTVQAKTKLAQIVTYLRTRQYGDATGPSPAEASTSPLYGLLSLPGQTTVIPEVTALAGLAFLRAYSVLGDASALTSALLAAAGLRNSQRTDIMTAGYTSDAGGGRRYLGGWTNTINTSTKAPSELFNNAGAVAIWFLTELAAIAGGSTVIGSTSAGPDFASAPSGTITQAISEAVEFYYTAKIPDASTGLPAAMISKETPSATFSSFMQVVSTGSGLYGFYSSPNHSLNGDVFSLAVRSLYEYEGYSTRVASMFEWLMSFTIDPTSSSIFDYDQSFALTTLMTVRRSSLPVTYAGTIYSLNCTGILAPLYIASGRSLLAFKNEIGKARRVSTGNETNRDFKNNYPLLAGQLFAEPLNPRVTSANISLLSGSTGGVPTIAMVYRYAPQALAAVA